MSRKRLKIPQLIAAGLLGGGGFPAFARLSSTVAAWDAIASPKYQDAAGTIPAIVNGDSVGYWGDLSPSKATPLIQSTTALKPVYVTNGTNAGTYINLNADYLQADGISSTLAFMSGSDKAFTMMLAMQSYNAASSAYLWCISDSTTATANNSYHLLGDAAGTDFFERRTGDDSSNATNSLPALPTFPEVVTFRYNGTTFDMWLNTTEATSGAALDTNAIANFDNICLGDVILAAGALGPSAVMGVYAGALYNVALSDSDIVAIATELQNRYGIT